MILHAFTAYNAPFYKQKQQLQTNWQCTIRRPCVFCSAKSNNCKRCCALPKWFRSHEANGCKLFGAVSCLLCSSCRLCTLLDGSWWAKQLWLLWPCTKFIHCPQMHSFTQPKTTTANRLVLYHACVAAPDTTAVNHMVLGWTCFAIELNSCKRIGTVPCVLQ